MVKAKVKLTYSVELFVEATDEDSILDWLNDVTPWEAKDKARDNGHVVDEDFEEEILCFVKEDSDVDVVIE